MGHLSWMFLHLAGPEEDSRRHVAPPTDCLPLPVHKLSGDFCPSPSPPPPSYPRLSSPANPPTLGDIRGGCLSAVHFPGASIWRGKKKRKTTTKPGVELTLWAPKRSEAYPPLLWAQHQPWLSGKRSLNIRSKAGHEVQRGAAMHPGSKPLSEPQGEKPLSASTLSPQPGSGPASGTHQDEETFVGKFLVLLDRGQDGQHQAAEDQQKSATAVWRGSDRGLDRMARGLPRCGWREALFGKNCLESRIRIRVPWSCGSVLDPRGRAPPHAHCPLRGSGCGSQGGHPAVGGGAVWAAGGNSHEAPAGSATHKGGPQALARF